MPNWKKIILSGSDASLNSLVVVNGITGSLLGTASYATNALSASFTSTASYVNTLNQNVLISGSLTVGTTSLGASENTLTLGPRDNGSEGGQLMLQAPGGTYTSASMWDNYANQTRLLRGTNAGSDAVVASFNMHTKQVQFPAYNTVNAFTGLAAAFLAVDSSGNLITTSSAGGGGSTTINNNVDNYIITGTGTLNTLNGESNLQFNGTSLTVTGQITSSGAIISQANGAMYFRGGDDAEFWDINVANTVGIYGQQTQTVAGLKLGSAGATLYGSGSRFGIGTTAPVATLDINGNLYVATGITGSFTGSLVGALTGTASWASNAVTASYILNAVSSSFATTASFFAAKGADTTIQFNKAGAFSGSSYFRYNYATESLQLGYTANPIQAIGRYSIAQGDESFAYTTGSVALNYSSKAGSLGYLATTSSLDTNIILIDASYGDVSGFFTSDPYVVTDDNDFNIFTLGTSVINVNINDPTPVGFDGTNTWISCSGDYNGTPVSSLYTTPFYVASYFSATPDNSNKYIGRYATAFNQSRAVGQGSIALLGGSAYGINSLALGLQGISIGDGAVAINGTAYGPRTISFRGNARGVFSFTHGGNNTTADGATGAHAEGTGTLASASYAHAEGSTTNAKGYASHAEGDSTIAQGTAAHSEGLLTYAQGEYSHAEGYLTVASGYYSHAEGTQTSGSGEGSHAEGFQTVALGNYSHVEGLNTIASGTYQTVIGQFNSQGNDSSLFIIGNGTSINDRNDLALFNKTNIVFKQNTIITGSLNVTGGITGSLLGTAISASYAANGGVTQLIAGSGVSLSPTTGVGAVTVSATGGPGGDTTAIEAQFWFLM